MDDLYNLENGSLCNKETSSITTEKKPSMYKLETVTSWPCNLEKTFCCYSILNGLSDFSNDHPVCNTKVAMRVVSQAYDCCLKSEIVGLSFCCLFFLLLL